MAEIQGWASRGPKQKLELFSFDTGPLGPEEVEIAVEYCGLCHSDLSVVNDEWGLSQYPVIPGHEAVGRIVAVGERVKGPQLGQRVGVGWNADSCMHCHECMAGDSNLCQHVVPTIVGHRGGCAARTLGVGDSAARCARHGFGRPAAVRRRDGVRTPADLRREADRPRRHRWYRRTGPPSNLPTPGAAK